MRRTSGDRSRTRLSTSRGSTSETARAEASASTHASRDPVPSCTLARPPDPAATRASKRGLSLVTSLLLRARACRVASARAELHPLVDELRHELSFRSGQLGRARDREPTCRPVARAAAAASRGLCEASATTKRTDPAERPMPSCICASSRLVPCTSRHDCCESKTLRGVQWRPSSKSPADRMCPIVGRDQQQLKHQRLRSVRDVALRLRLAVALQAQQRACARRPATPCASTSSCCSDPCGTLYAMPLKRAFKIAANCGCRWMFSTYGDATSRPDSWRAAASSIVRCTSMRRMCAHSSSPCTFPSKPRARAPFRASTSASSASSCESRRLAVRRRRRRRLGRRALLLAMRAPRAARARARPTPPSRA